MAYRIIERPKPKREDFSNFQDVTSLSRFTITNGAISDVGVPCWYWIPQKHVRAFPHDRPLHDHLGWPTPTHPDHICQEGDMAYHPDRDRWHRNHPNVFGDEAYCEHPHMTGPMGNYHQHPHPGEDVHLRHSMPDTHGKYFNYLDMSRLVPIHLSAEGYNQVIIKMNNPPTGFSITGSIDELEDWIIRLRITAQCPSAVTENIHIPFAVHVSDGDRTDVVMVTKATVLKAPWI